MLLSIKFCIKNLFHLSKFLCHFLLSSASQVLVSYNKLLLCPLYFVHQQILNHSLQQRVNMSQGNRYICFVFVLHTFCFSFTSETFAHSLHARKFMHARNRVVFYLVEETCTRKTVFPKKPRQMCKFLMYRILVQVS